MSVDARWQIQLLGDLRAERDGQVVTRFRTRKTGELLAYLAYHRGRSHPREVLIELLWPECDPDAGRHSLNVALSSLRAQLEPPGVPTGSVIAADVTSVRLNPKAISSDVAEFEERLNSAQTAQPAERIRTRHQNKPGIFIPPGIPPRRPLIC